LHQGIEKIKIFTEDYLQFLGVVRSHNCQKMSSFLLKLVREKKNAKTIDQD
jgi:hypothetical protein